MITSFGSVVFFPFDEEIARLVSSCAGTGGWTTSKKQRHGRYQTVLQAGMFFIAAPCLLSYIKSRGSSASAKPHNIWIAL
jgi:hypothetical protein